MWRQEEYENEFRRYLDNWARNGDMDVDNRCPWEKGESKDGKSKDIIDTTMSDTDQTNIDTMFLIGTIPAQLFLDWVHENEDALLEICGGLLLQLLGAGSDMGQASLTNSTGGAALVLAPAQTVSSAAVKTVGAGMIVNGVSRLNMSSSGGDVGGGLVKGKPDVPQGAKMLRRDTANVKSTEFKDFIRNQGKNFRSNEWKYKMETWQLKDGTKMERHYWQNIKTGESYYHL